MDNVPISYFVEYGCDLERYLQYLRDRETRLTQNKEAFFS